MEKKKTIWDYFNDNIEYPGEVAHNSLPYGTVWCYISSTFLNGFINYVKPIKIYQIDRYQGEDELQEVDCRDKGDYAANWKKFTGTKAELRKLVLSEKIEFAHTKLNLFSDDIALIAEIEHNEDDGKGRYMFFWFDCDVSDCCIGKFETTDTKEEVILSMVNWLEEEKTENKGRTAEPDCDNGIVNYTELPISFLEGWLSF